MRISDWSSDVCSSDLDAAALMLSGKPFKKQASIAKLISSEAAMDNARDATQIHGGYGFMNEYAVARHYRDSQILEIGENGRAWCRERVCQYVDISVGGVSFTKKNKQRQANTNK